MKKVTVVMVMLLLGAFMLQPIASAEMIQGIVGSLDLGSNSLNLTRVNPTTGVSEDLKIIIRADAEFAGIASLSELQSGAEVRVDASKKGEGTYEAKKIEALTSATQPVEGQGQVQPAPA